MTGFIYLYTLFRVYSPPTKLRIAVISAMAVILVAVLVLFPSFFSISFRAYDIIYIALGIAMIIFLNKWLIKAYDWIYKKMFNS